MKKNNRGFTLVETLVVSAFIIGVLVFLFAEFTQLKKSYDVSFEFNTIPALYKAKNIDRYITSTGNELLIQALENSSGGFIDITTCPSEYVMKTDYCKTLFSDLRVSSVFAVKESTLKTSFEDELKDNKTGFYHEKLYQFVKNMNINNENYEGYRLVVEFEGDQFGTVKLSN